MPSQTSQRKGLVRWRRIGSFGVFLGTAVHCNAAAGISFDERAGNGSRVLCDTAVVEDVELAQDAASGGYCAVRRPAAARPETRVAQSR